MSYQQPNRSNYKCSYCGATFEEFDYLMELTIDVTDLIWCGQCKSVAQEDGLPPERMTQE
jgi:DNA-directed RNA polymerase subunit RPC12/RpoP